MFTGLIEDIGTLGEVRRSGEDVTLEITTSIPTAELELGESIAVNGVCLTVRALGLRHFTVDASSETLSLTSLGRLQRGDRVHLERAMRADGRLGGHIVQGHVDGTGVLARRTTVGKAWDLWIEAPPHLLDELVPKGSVTVDGVSLTVNELGPSGFRLTIIPHTSDKTLLTELAPGSVVNIETDVLGKYIRRYLGADQKRSLGSLLESYGYTSSQED